MESKVPDINRRKKPHRDLNRALVRSTDEAGFIDAVCRIVQGTYGYHLVLSALVQGSIDNPLVKGGCAFKGAMEQGHVSCERIVRTLDQEKGVCPAWSGPSSWKLPGRMPVL